MKADMRGHGVVTTCGALLPIFGEFLGEGENGFMTISCFSERASIISVNFGEKVLTFVDATNETHSNLQNTRLFQFVFEKIGHITCTRRM